MSKSNTAEGGTDGAGALGTVATAQTGSGDSWDVATTGNDAILDYTNGSVMHGSLSYRNATRSVAQANYFAHTTTAAASWFGRFYLLIDNITATTRIAQFRVSEVSFVIGAIYCANTGALQIRPAADTPSLYTFATLTLGSWYRVEWNTVANGTTTGTIQVRLYAGDSTSLTEDSGVISVTASGTVSTWGDVRYGSWATSTNLPSSTGFLYYDDLIEFATDWPGPSLTAADVGPLESAKDFISASRFGPF